ncbi:ABC transporter ATP-binding protein [Thermogladius sp. KZ2Tp1]|uniref:ABC transporter ATP-binding protein n=1 Tax=Thermogladius sp. KZ2Tp1 TaxID=3136289 RepID=UPI003DA90E9F
MTDIVFEKATVGYLRTKPLIVDVDLVLKPGLHILLGPNGSGKSALLKTVAGLISPLYGRVLVDGIEPYKERRRKVAAVVGITWQDPYYGFVEPTVRDEVNLILRQLRARGNTDVADRLVPQQLWDRDPFSLSGGEAKRVSLASVLVADQPVWLLDEPFDNLDSDGVRRVSEIVREGKQRGKNIVVALHNPFYLEVVESDSVLIIDKDKRSLDVFKGGEVDDSVLERYGVLSRRMICR